MFASIASKISDKSITASDIWGTTAASSIGQSREIKATRKFDDCDILDKYAPSVIGFVIKAQSSSKLTGVVDVTIAVKDVMIDPACKHVQKLPSGDIVQIITTIPRSIYHLQLVHDRSGPTPSTDLPDTYA